LVALTPLVPPTTSREGLLVTNATMTHFHVMVGVNWAFVGGDNNNIAGHQLGICRQQQHRCWWASTGLEPTWVGIDVAAFSDEHSGSSVWKLG